MLEGKDLPRRERDTLEVRHYFRALAQIETWVEVGSLITEARIWQYHALVYTGKDSRPMPNWDG